MKNFLFFFLFIILCPLVYSYNPYYLHGEKNNDVYYTINNKEIKITEPTNNEYNSKYGNFIFTVNKDKMQTQILDYDKYYKQIINKIPNKTNIKVFLKNTMTVRLYSGIATVTDGKNISDIFTYNIIPETGHAIVFEDIFGKNSNKIKSKLSEVDINKFSFTDLGISWYDQKGCEIHSLSYIDIKDLADPSLEIKDAMDELFKYEYVEFNLKYNGEIYENDSSVVVLDANKFHNSLSLSSSTMCIKAYIHPIFFEHETKAVAHFGGFAAISDWVNLSKKMDFAMRKPKPEETNRAIDALIPIKEPYFFTVKGKFDLGDLKIPEDYYVVFDIYDSNNLKEFKETKCYFSIRQYIRENKNNEFNIRFNGFSEMEICDDRCLYFRVYIITKETYTTYPSDMIKISSSENSDVGTVKINNSQSIYVTLNYLNSIN